MLKPLNINLYQFIKENDFNSFKNSLIEQINKDTIIDKNQLMNYTIQAGNLEMVRLLVKHDFPINDTYLFLIVKYGHSEKLSLLLEKIDLNGEQKETLLGYAIQESSLKIVQELVDLDFPISLACLGKCLQIFDFEKYRYLLEHYGPSEEEITELENIAKETLLEELYAIHTKYREQSV